MVIALTSPLHVGIYEANHLIEEFHESEQTSEALPKIFETLLERYTPARLFFAKGPGSFMSIKITYIFLKTLSIALGIPLYAADGFMFNEGRPIRAMRQLYFVKNEQGIQTQRFELPQEQIFCLPQIVDETLFETHCEPLYLLPAV